ncbi:MAG: efflux transporter outer membrane subunit [Legionellaceae bacterium]|nr:efflux transporter outer membrane subunit [Legionellaceae bacterium]
MNILMFFRKLVAVALLLSLEACSFAPPYQVPEMSLPANYKETGTWLQVKSPVQLTERSWWKLFHDDTLNVLEKKVSISNQNLKVAWAQYQKALAIAQSIRSAEYPTIIAIGNSVRQQSSKTAANTVPGLATLYNSFLLTSELTYEIDAWGKVRNAVVSGNSSARASEFDLAAVNLSLHATMAKDYFKLRGLDESQRILDMTVRAYQKALYLTQQRHKGGIAPIADVDQAITQLENAKTLGADNRLKRAKIEHAMAVLAGEMPESFSIPPRKTVLKVIKVPPYLPSTLLEHRPDVAAAEERVRAANADIGVARAAFFPELNLITLLGFQSAQLSNLFSAPSLFWSLGPPTILSLVQSEATGIIFDGFKLQAQLKYAKASYFQTVSSYRQTVLTAFQEVEDALVAIHRLEEENGSQTLSTAAARRAWYQENQRYKGGIVTFLSVVITENQALQAELALVSIRTRLQMSCVQLIQVLGGGWKEPSMERKG